MTRETIHFSQQQLADLRQAMLDGALYKSLGIRIGKLIDELPAKTSVTPVAQLSQSEETAIIELSSEIQHSLLEDELESISDGELAILVNGLGQKRPEIREEACLKVLVQLIQNQILTTDQIDILQKHILRPEVLFFHITENANDGVFLRSFNVCLLAILKLWEQPVAMDKAEYEDMIMLLATYLLFETDTRGFDDEQGWFRTYFHIGHILDALTFDNQVVRMDKIFLMTVMLERYKRLDTPLTMGEEQRLAGYLTNIVKVNSLYADYFLLQLKQMRQQFVQNQEPTTLAGWNRFYNKKRLWQALQLQSQLPENISNYLRDMNFF